MMYAHKKAFLMALITTIGLSACATVEQKMTDAGAQRLNQEQAIAHVTGNTEVWSQGGGYYDPDGSMQTVWKGVKSSGTYTVSEDGKVCNKLDKNYCHIYMNDNGAIIMVYNGKNEGVREMLVGNKVSEL